ncbi:MAG: hypothetical protein M1822_009957 [Bathelium mastoideum]|nr:MAG: hypothetical protein M1822_009957 [Bathelium mastoideum]
MFFFSIISPLLLGVTLPLTAASRPQRATRTAQNSTEPCAVVSASVASLFATGTPSATPTVAAELAYDCLNSVPLHSDQASALLDSLYPYILWQTTTSYLKNPPAEYVEKIQPAVDVYAELSAIGTNITSGAYQSEYEFGFNIYKVFQTTHDGHFVYVPDIVGSFFTFGRTIPLVSVSQDGVSLPKQYVYADVLQASLANSSYTPSAITEIDGQNSTEYLLNLSEVGSLQDRDALWNNLFYNLAQISLGSSGTTVGVFGGGGRGRWVYPGPTTTLTFENGTTATYENFARVLVDFAGIESGEDLYNTYIVPEEVAATSTAAATTAAPTANTTSIASTSATSTTSTPAPGYPSPVIRQSNNLNGGYFLDGEEYSDVAVLSVPSFVGLDSAEQEFQFVNQQFIADALAANKTKLIIDVSANAGGTILQGYDLFKQLFPQYLPYGATRFRAHQGFDLIGEKFSEVSTQFPRSLDLNDTVEGIISSVFDYQTDANISYQPFTSWPVKYGPHEYNGDNFTSIIRWNLSDPVSIVGGSDIVVSGYLNRSNVTTEPFARDNVIIVYDGYCASTCTIFSEFMRQQAGVKTIALGGRPQPGIIQAVGGVKGTNDYPWTYIKELVEQTFELANSSAETAFYNSSELGSYSNLPLYRGANGVTLAVNARDGIRQGDTTETPLQFRYEPADCRILYTPEMTVDVTAIWKTVADTVWNGKDACIAGSNDFYGNGTYAKRQLVTRAAWPRTQSGPQVEAMMQALHETIPKNTNGEFGAGISPLKRSIMAP